MLRASSFWQEGSKEVEAIISQGLGALLGPRGCAGSCRQMLQASFRQGRQVNQAFLLCRPYPLVPEGPDGSLACGFVSRWH